MISVVLPFHKNLLLLNRSLLSIEKQKMLPEEVIVIDNSSDGILDDFTYPGSESFKKKLEIVSTSLYWDVADARNVGIKSVKTGNFIAFLDSGDIWHPNHLSEANEVLQKNYEAKKVVYYPSYINWDIARDKYLVRQSQKIRDREEIFKLCPIGTSSVVIKSDETIKFPSYRLRHDLALWAQLIDAGFKLINNSNINMLRIIENESLSRNIFLKIYYQVIVYKNAVGFNIPLLSLFLFSQALFKLQNLFKWKSSIDDIFTVFGFVDCGFISSKNNAYL